MSTFSWRAVARSAVIVSVGGCLAFTGLGGVAPARADGGDLSAPLPRIRIEPYLVAATGKGLVNLLDENDATTVSVSTDRGSTWTDVDQGLRRAKYASGNTVRYTDDRDGGPSELFSYDLQTGDTSDGLQFAGMIAAVGRNHVVYGTNGTEDEPATAFAAAPVGDPTLPVDLTMPDRAADTTRFLIGADDLGVAVSTSRDSRGRVQTGYLDPVALTGGTSDYAGAVVPGLFAAASRGDRVSYLTASSTAVKACQRSLASQAAWQVESCVTVATGDYREVNQGTLAGGSDWAAFSLYRGDTYLGAYVANWSTSKPTVVRLKASGSVTMVLLSTAVSDLDRPLVTAYTTYTSSSKAGYLATVGTSGAMTRYASWPTGALQPKELSLTNGRLAGTDARSGGTAWTRPLNDEGEERILATKAKQIQVSAGWTAVNGASGLMLYDHDKKVATTTPWASIWRLSGPYLIGKAKAKDKAATVLAAGKRVTFSSRDMPSDVFGSWVATIDVRSWQARVFNVKSGKPVAETTIDIDQRFDSAAISLWGDTLAINGWLPDGGTEVVFYDWRNGTQSGTLAYDHDASLYGLSDGAALIEHDDGRTEAVSLAGLTTDLTFDERGPAPALDDVGRVIYTSERAVIVHQIPNAGTSAPRALWSSAPSSFNSFAGGTAPFRVSVDATKALSAGELVIQKAGAGDTPLVRVPVKASPDGSLRLSWNGLLDDGTPAAAGEWGWHLEGFDELRALDASAFVSGTVKVTNTKTAYPQSTPSIDDTKPATGDVLTAAAGRLPAGTGAGYQWYRGSKAIKDAVAKSYQVAAADVGYALKVKVSIPASAHYLATSKTSKATAKTVKGTLLKGSVAIVGDDPQVDAPLTAKPDGWGPGSVAVAYQWYRVDAKGKAKPISKATKSSYLPTGADVGAALRVTVTGSKSGYASRSADSAISAKVLAGAYSDVGPVTIAGDALVGSKLQARPGTYLVANGTAVTPAFGYQWYRVTGSGKVAIKGATTSSYKVTSGDRGLPLTVRVVATRSGYPAQTTWSDSTTPVG